MSKHVQSKKGKEKKVNPLLIFALVIVVVTGAALFFTSDKGTADNETTDNTETDKVSAVNATNEDGDVVFQISDITEEATFYETDVNGTTVGLFAVKASDGTIRTALNTCQVCNGSPYAYFEQQDDKFQCQNCGNIFPLDMIAQERGGCNPVPITEEERTESDTEIIIPAELLEENAARFKEWKKF